MQLSKRLAAVAALVSPGNRIADVGTDHGYIPIFLIENGICPNAIAMDIRRGPLQRAKDHVMKYGLESKIEMRLSDGVAALMKGEAETLVIAGMGGNVMIHILEQGHEVIKSIKECILQPQSDTAKFRRYLQENGYRTVAEDIVEEDGKYYPMMKVIPEPFFSYIGEKIVTEQENENYVDNELYYQFGRLLLEQKHPILKKFLESKWDKTCTVIQNLKDNAETGIVRLAELQEQKKQIEQALRIVDMSWNSGGHHEM